MTLVPGYHNSLYCTSNHVLICLLYQKSCLHITRNCQHPSFLKLFHRSKLFIHWYWMSYGPSVIYIYIWFCNRAIWLDNIRLRYHNHDKLFCNKIICLLKFWICRTMETKNVFLWILSIFLKILIVPIKYRERGLSVETGHRILISKVINLVPQNLKLYYIDINIIFDLRRIPKHTDVYSEASPKQSEFLFYL